MWSIYVLIFGCWDLRWRMYGTYWTCGQCCLSDMQVVGSNIVIGLYAYWTCGQCCVFHMWVVEYNIAVGLCMYWTYGQCCVFYMYR